LEEIFLLLSFLIIKNDLESLISEDRVNFLIVDDSFYSRTRSKSVDPLANVFDYVDRRNKKDFRMLTLGWSDLNAILPLAFTLLRLSSEKK
jgi:hypothetical protein